MARIAPRQRGAWIETPSWGRHFAGCNCIAPRQRGAWIETAAPADRRASFPGIAPRQRGAWIETSTGASDGLANRCIAPRQRGAWIETCRNPFHLAGKDNASPLGNGGRGLKQEQDHSGRREVHASPLGNGGRGLKLEVYATHGEISLHRPSATGGVD